MSGSKSNFEMLVAEAKLEQKKGSNVWTHMVRFAVMDVSLVDGADALKDAFKAQEQKYKEQGVNLPEMGSYRSSKSVVVSAFKLGVPVMVGGKVRGKTEVEKDIKALKEKEQPIDTIKRAYTLIGKKIGECNSVEEANTIYMLAKDAFAQAEAFAASQHGMLKAA